MLAYTGKRDFVIKVNLEMGSLYWIIEVGHIESCESLKVKKIFQLQRTREIATWERFNMTC